MTSMTMFTQYQNPSNFEIYINLQLTGKFSLKLDSSLLLE